MVSRKKTFLTFAFSFLFLFSTNILPTYAQEQVVTDGKQNEEVSSESTGNLAAAGNPSTTSPSVQSMAATNISFSDVNSQYWAYTNISHLSSLGIIGGYEKGGAYYFNPNDNVTRAQAAKMIVESLNLGELNVSTSSFKDIPASHWASGYIERVSSLKIFGGYQDGTFGPNDPLKRSQMAVVIAKAFKFGYNGYNPDQQVFKDVAPAYWANEYILKLHYNGISNGSNFSFKPETRISRSEFSAFLSRAIDEKYRVPVLGPVLQPSPGTTVAKGEVVAASSLNIRQAPSTSSSIVGRVSLGTEVSITSMDGYWAKINYNGLTGYVHKSYLKLKSTDANNPIKGRIIVVDPGHGKQDPGASVSGINEKDIVLKVSKKLAAKLEAAGAKVVMTRSTDNFLSLEERVAYAKSVYAETYISVHVNAAGSTAAKGAEVFYDTSTNVNGTESKKLAYEIQREIVSQAKMNDRGIKDTGFYVIRNNQVPSVLVELGFLTNADDRKKLTSETYLNIYADAIYKGVLQYYRK
ncbi:N-acetylmuramoyl-L-alanine amidase [Bacillus infantis]|uniref:N-acetylmuramoyl-L-alanine amidase n=1 Tax=Bacillus infantis TaxID=324767 RepID=UPI000B9BB09C|nr:N-acetylmuramoyl-L-alanine amidase [Bacillus infantis]MCK6206049.1 N-acetylmuramoyl-L-alanine amidase [Bacillus infantis]OXT16756.1 hypothetical protein B9K06_13755 [Bacillus sp. OG2]